MWKTRKKVHIADMLVNNGRLNGRVESHSLKEASIASDIFDRRCPLFLCAKTTPSYVTEVSGSSSYQQSEAR